MLAGVTTDSPMPSNTRMKINPLIVLTIAVAAETTLHSRNAIAYGHFTPYRSMTHPAGACSAAYDQKNADSTIPETSGDIGSVFRISGSAEDKLIRSMYAMMTATVRNPTTVHRIVRSRGAV